MCLGYSWGDHELEERSQGTNDIQAALYNRALQNRTAHTKTCLSMQDVLHTE